MKKTTQQRRSNVVPINTVNKEQNDFGYQGQKFFRAYKWPVYRCKTSPYVYFPFAMENMVKAGVIEPSQVVRFMGMLESENIEIERLAIITLQELLRKMYPGINEEEMGAIIDNFTK